MPRTPRVLSSTGIYHIILRGINKQDIFEDSEDFQFFLHLLHKVKETSDFKLYAYCLMNNHVHFLMQTCETGDTLESIFKSFESRFVLWYNKKYARTGHLFQDRFLSKPVEDEHAFKVVFRYIHQNPMKAGLEIAPGCGYPWSSYAYYSAKTALPDSIADLFAGRNPLVDTVFPISVFGQKELLKQFCEYLSAKDECMEYETSFHPKVNTDPAVVDQLCSSSGCRNFQEFKTLSRDTQYYYIKQLNNSGISLRQLSRITGFSRKTLAKL